LQFLHQPSFPLRFAAAWRLGGRFRPVILCHAAIVRRKFGSVNSYILGQRLVVPACFQGLIAAVSTTAMPSKRRVMSPAKSPAIVVSLPAMLTGAGIKERWHCRPFRAL
jgi:hypothetical protein